MGDKKDSNYELICSRELDPFKLSEDRYSELGKALKAAFLVGPSDAVLSKGKIETLSSEEIKVDPEDIDDSDPSWHEPDELNKTDNNNYIRNNYTILEAYLNTKPMFEDTKATPEIMPSKDTFVNGGIYNIRVGLPKEGYSIWKVAVNSKSLDKKSLILTALKSGKFKAAYDIASKDIKTDGLVPIALYTYVYKKADCHSPWLGHCRYGLGSGSDDDNNPETNTIAFALAPLVANKKTDSNIILKTLFNVVGDVTDGAIGELAQQLGAVAGHVADRVTGDRSRDDYDDSKNKGPEENINDALDKFLRKRFKCVGDSTMYKQFLQCREYLKAHLKKSKSDDKSLEVDWDETVSFKKLAESCKAELRFFSY